MKHVPTSDADQPCMASNLAAFTIGQLGLIYKAYAEGVLSSAGCRQCTDWRSQTALELNGRVLHDGQVLQS